MDYDTVTLLVTAWLWNAKLCLSCSGTNAVEFARGFTKSSELPEKGKKKILMMLYLNMIDVTML